MRRPGIPFLMVLSLGLIASHRPASADSEPTIATVSSDPGAKQPQATVDAQGRIHVAFGIGNTVWCASTTDGGREFAAPVQVGSVPTLALGMRRGPRIAATDQAVVVTAIGGKEGKGRDGDLLAWRSTDHGRTWAGPSRVNSQKASAREGLHALAAGPKGDLFCVWLDDRHQRKEVFGSRSSDGGATWEPDHLIYRSPETSVCPCCHPSVTYGPDGTLYVMWRNDVNGARDLYLTRSTDGGQTFASAEKLGKGTWPLNACPMDGGAVAAGPGHRVETVWMRNGSMFAAEPGQPERDLGHGVQGWAAAGPDGLYAAWLIHRPGQLLVLRPGESQPSVLAEAAADPALASAPGGRGPVVAVWESKSGAGGLSAAVLASP